MAGVEYQLQKFETSDDWFYLWKNQECAVVHVNDIASMFRTNLIQDFTGCGVKE